MLGLAVLMWELSDWCRLSRVSALVAAVPHVSQCSFFRAREGLENADIVVTNHDLVLSDLRLGGGVILPAPEDCFYYL